MSAYSSLFPNYRFVGHSILNNSSSMVSLGMLGGTPFYPGAGTWPSIADDYTPMYGTSPNTKYGSCLCLGGGLNVNNCNVSNGYYPVCLLDGQNCVCTSKTNPLTDFGCYSKPRSNCSY